MANTFPTASTVIRRLKTFGIDALPAYRIHSGAGCYVHSGLAHTFGPTIEIRGNDCWDVATRLAKSLDEAGWDVEQQVPHYTRIRVNSIPKAVRS